MTLTAAETLTSYRTGYRWMGQDGLPTLSPEADAIILAAIALVPSLPRSKTGASNGNNLRGLARKTGGAVKRTGAADAYTQAQAVAYAANLIHKAEGIDIRF